MRLKPEPVVHRSPAAQGAARRRYRETTNDCKKYKQNDRAWADNYVMKKRKMFNVCQLEYKQK